jgi:gliding motility-associated-like protein
MYNRQSVCNCLKYFFACIFLLTVNDLIAQCNTDSNYFSLTYTASNQNNVAKSVVTLQNEVIALIQNSAKTGFATKFTSQGNVIWSNEYVPDYPFVNYIQYPWYNDTELHNIFNASDGSAYVVGSSREHGRSINNVEEPPSHLVGFLLHLDKFGGVIYCKYFGNWFTDYVVSSGTELNDGRLLIYLSSHFTPNISKILCINKDGNIDWGLPVQSSTVYEQIDNPAPLIKQLRSGDIAIGMEYRRTVEDTIIYPFQPPIFLPPPIYCFNFFIINSQTGQIKAQSSYECPDLNGASQYPDVFITNVKEDFIPELKGITELPGGEISFCADMYMPVDSVIFYKHTVFSKRVVNFILSNDGFFAKLISYSLQNTPLTLQDVWQTDNSGGQVLLAKDSTNQKLVLIQLNNKGVVEWSKSFASPIPTKNSDGTICLRQGNKGYFIFQSDPGSHSFHLSITNSAGDNPCVKSQPEKIVASESPWPWPSKNVLFVPNILDIDFRLSPFKILVKKHPVTQNIDCYYQSACCKDVIDTLHTKYISLCENQTYILPDSTVVSATGRYYQTLQTKDGCDSVTFYDVTVFKSPSHLQASADACLNNNTSVELRATGGYESYIWNGLPSPDSVFTATAAGTYTVKVDNFCGSKTDTVKVFETCDFPIYFPSAFTPNGDFLNDILKVPVQNKNKLIRLSVYDRWGNLVFATTDPDIGWNGSRKSIPQPVGIYIYYLEMEGLSGRKLNQKGTVALIR